MWAYLRGRYMTVCLHIGRRAGGDFRYCGFFRRVRGTGFSRNYTLVYSPLCAVMSALAVWLSSGY
ncbi:DUF3995 domain-containing protein [bacterium]|nr:DUF3995 domain-containing protein [bacterium]MBU1676262.1 DUF3995 domain-containing protein [bacterium]